MLQEELGISRFALRAGLARLNALGIISSAQGKASVINGEVNTRSLCNAFAPLAAGDSRKFIEDFFAFRLLLEVEGAGLAATKRTAAHAAALQALLSNPAHRTESMAWHRKIVTAIAAGNGKAARTHMTGY